LRNNAAVGHLTIKPGLFDGEVAPNRTILQVLLDIGYPMHYSCRRGLCGQDMIRVLKGAEFLSPIEEPEGGTLEMLRVRDQPMRMACSVYVIGNGEVVVEIV
jgi:ferredoxin